MDLSNYFGKQYIKIDATHDNAIKLFLENSKDIQSERKYIEPLETVYMHKTYNEMFLILNCINISLEEIKDECTNWENNVLSYINFGEEFRDSKKFLKYNTTLIIICKDEDGEDDDDYRYEIEKSKTICRKIFIIVDKDGNILEDNKSMIPFYFKTISTVYNEKIKEYEIKLEELLPEDKILKKIMEKDETLSDEQIKLMLGWVEKYE